MFTRSCAWLWRPDDPSRLFIAGATVCFAHTAWDATEMVSFECFYQYGGESQSGLKPAGSPDNWRCIALDKLASVELLNGPWRTAPNHSRPASCIVDADVDAEDYPERDPQQGQ
jgi:hypothetical protein